MFSVLSPFRRETQLGRLFVFHAYGPMCLWSLVSWSCSCSCQSFWFSEWRAGHFPPACGGIYACWSSQNFHFLNFFCIRMDRVCFVQMILVCYLELVFWGANCFRFLSLRMQCNQVVSLCLVMFCFIIRLLVYVS